MNLHDRDIQRAARRKNCMQKAIEDAVIAVRDFNVTPQIAAEKMYAPLDKVLEKLKINRYYGSRDSAATQPVLPCLTPALLPALLSAIERSERAGNRSCCCGYTG